MNKTFINGLALKTDFPQWICITFLIITLSGRDLEIFKLKFLRGFKVQLLSEKVGDQPESHCDKEKKVEFSVPTWQASKKIWIQVN